MLELFLDSLGSDQYQFPMRLVFLLSSQDVRMRKRLSDASI